MHYLLSDTFDPDLKPVKIPDEIPIPRFSKNLSSGDFQKFNTAGSNFREIDETCVAVVSK